jgi:hypothetical protein
MQKNSQVSLPTTACYYNEVHKFQFFLIFSFLKLELTHFLDGGAAKTEERLKLEAFFLDDFVAKVWIIIFYILFWLASSVQDFLNAILQYGEVKQVELMNSEERYKYDLEKACR